MKKIETMCGYDLYELTKEECNKHWYEYPCIAIFCEGETYDTVGCDESTFETIKEARAWCKEYDRT